MKHLYWLITIIQRADTREYEEFYLDRGVNVTYGIPCNGTAHAKTLNLLGLERTEKTMLFSIVTHDTLKTLKRRLTVDMKIDLPNRGVAMAIPLLFDITWHKGVSWSGYVAGGILLAYIMFVLPCWFKKPNPVIFVPCDFAAVALYLWYVEFASGGAWFWPFALPVLAVVAAITCALVTLLRYLRRGKLYVVGGAMMALGAWTWMVEELMGATFDLAFIGWSLYPAISLLLLGGLMIYLAMNSVAREKIERRIFF